MVGGGAGAGGEYDGEEDQHGGPDCWVEWKSLKKKR